MNVEGTLKYPTEASLNNMRKTRSRTWQVRAQRYLQIIPEQLKNADMRKPGGRKQLRKWVTENS